MKQIIYNLLNLVTKILPLFSLLSIYITALGLKEDKPYEIIIGVIYTLLFILYPLYTRKECGICE